MAGVGRCRDCGEEIHWFQSVHGRTHAPMVPGKETVSIVIDGVVYTGREWHRHVCDPERVTAHIADQMRRAEALEKEKRIKREAEEAREERRQRYLDNAEVFQLARDAREAFAVEVYKRAMRYHCDKCGAVPQEPCENLSFAKRGAVQYTKNPHLERIELIPDEQRPFWISTTEFVAPDQPKETP